METSNDRNLKSWTVTTEEDGEGNLVLPLPTDLLETMGWHIGDVLEWHEQDGTWSLTKKN